MELWRTASGIEPIRLRRLTDGMSQVAFPVWSSDGTRLAFLTDRDDADYGIYVLRVNGSMLARVLDSAAMYSSLAWDPRGERIAYVCDRQICLLELNTGGSAALGESLPAGLYASSPAWSPDGTRLAFVSNRAGVPAIFTMDGEGKDVQKLADDPALPQSLAWSPTGEWIAVGSDAPGRGIFLLRPDGSEVRLLVENAYYPTWSPDGRWLAYTARPLESLQPVILLIDVLEALQGRAEPVRLTEDNVYNDFPAWAPNSTGLAER
jgi:TolB protein